MAALENIEENEHAYAKNAKILDETEAVSTKAMNNSLNELSEKEKDYSRASKARRRRREGG